MSSSRILGNRHLRYLVPFLLFVVGGSVGLREFTTLRYKYRLSTTYNPKEEARKLGLETKKPEEISLEAQYKDLKKQNLNEWENKRVPRPKSWTEQN